MRLPFLIGSLGLLAGCGATSPGGVPSEHDPADAATPSPNPSGTGSIGTPCSPGSEDSPSFDGFNDGEIITTGLGSSGSPVCMAYHFQGLVTCPYGQSATGEAPPGASPCTTLGGEPVVGAVLPQCTDRRASEVVLWSCRCANIQGMTDDGSSYCTCPSDTACTQAVTSIGAADDDYSGAYCLPPGSAYDGVTACASRCDPTSAPCL